jgi:hypothetical protein
MGHEAVLETLLKGYKEGVPRRFFANLKNYTPVSAEGEESWGILKDPDRGEMPILVRSVADAERHHRLLPRYAAWRLQQADLGKPESLEVFRDALNKVRRLFSPILSSPSAPEVRLVVGVEFRDVEKEP